jgi:predicted acylesterase/phospholipase RssA
MPLVPRRALLAAPALLAACAPLPRGEAVPRSLTRRASVLGLPNERFNFLDDPAPIDAEFQAASARAAARRPPGTPPVGTANLLAVSGGGEDGAFGAGLLCGWTQSGRRPVFHLVTGVSTGALTAPFAYLGPAYDPQLRAVYTEVSAADIAERRNLLRGALADAFADTTPLFRLISKHVDMEMQAALARSYAEGRLLFIGTTNLDAQVPMVWNIGAMATLGTQRSLEVIRKVLLASSAIPGAFTPVMFDVTADGQPHQELHVDGGAFAQAFLYPPSLGEARARREVRGNAPLRRVDAFVIRNARLDPGWASVDRRSVTIAARAVQTMIFVSGVNDIIRMRNAALRDRVNFNLAYISPDFTQDFTESFDPVYMRALFDYGYAKGLAGGEWRAEPPFFGLSREAAR